MIKQIVFATNNAHKLSEVQAVLGDRFRLVTLAECGITEEIPEDAPTLEGNALQKARYVHERTGADCFADDTGLEVDALGGAPGVHSARYATDGHDFAANNRLLLRNLADAADRSAHFRTVIALILDGREYLSRGVWTDASPRARRAAGDSAMTRCSCRRASTRPSPRWVPTRRMRFRIADALSDGSWSFYNRNREWKRRFTVGTTSTLPKQ